MIDGQVIDGQSLYHIAETSGLRYGTAFRLVEEVRVGPDNVISVQLAPITDSARTRFLLDPMRLDSAAHGLFSVFPELRYEERGVTFIPIRIDEVILYRPHVVPARAINEIVSKSERSIVANVYLYDGEGNIIAILRNVRSQAVNVRRANRVENFAVIERPELLDGELIGHTGVRADVANVVACAQDLGLLAEKGSGKPEASLLLEAWAMAAAYEIASGLARENTLDLDVLIAAGRMPEELRGWLANLLLQLESAGLATQSKGLWTLGRDASLPPSQAVIKAIAAEQPALAAELALAGAVSGLVQKIRTHRRIPQAAEFGISKATLGFFHAAHGSINDAADALDQILAEAGKIWPKHRALRMLQIGYSPLLHKMAARIGSKTVEITVFEPDQGQFERLRAAVPQANRVTAINAEQVNDLGTYDLIVSVEGLHRLPANMSLAEVKALLAPRGLLLAVEPQPSLFRDLVFGLDPNWFLPSLDRRPVSPIQASESWLSSAQQAGFVDVEVRPLQCRSAPLSLLIGKRGAASSASLAGIEEESRSIQLVAADGEAESADGLLSAIKSLRPSITVLTAGNQGGMADIVVLLPPASSARADPVEALTQRCLLIKSCAERMNGAQSTLWLVFRGALAGGNAPVRPIETGAWAFSRTLANELQNLDVRRLDISPDVSLPGGCRSDRENHSFRHG